MITFDKLRRANIKRDGEWNPDSQLSLSFQGCELAGEVGELCNILKKIERERLGLVGSRATKEQAMHELADVVICADLIAMTLGIDLGLAVVEKFNYTTAKYSLLTRL